MPYRYTPLLRSKSGETIALQNLSAQAKQRIVPLIHLVAEPPDTFAQAMGNAWPGLPAALDGTYNFQVTGSPAAFTSMLGAMGRAGVRVIPSVECDAPGQYVAAAQRLVGRFAPGLIVKGSLRQLPNIGGWVRAQNWQPSEVDLVVTAGHAADYPPQQFHAFVKHALQQDLADGAQWRSVTLAASAAPQDHSSLAFGRNDVPRLDWILWNAVAPRSPYSLHYGDYGTLYPELDEPPGLAMTRATVSVRYAVADNWIIIKGRSTTGARGQPMGQQYRGHARTLAGDPAFGQLNNCWADNRIQTIAALQTNTGAGNRGTWAAINANRHLSVVANALS